MNEVQKEIMEMVCILQEMTLSELKDLREESLKELERRCYSPGSRKLCVGVIDAILKEKENTVNE